MWEIASGDFTYLLGNLFEREQNLWMRNKVK